MFLIINALNRLHLKSLGSFFSIFFSNAQGELKAVEGYTPKIGEIVYMLKDLKDRITTQVKDLDQSQVNYLYDLKILITSKSLAFFVRWPSDGILSYK